MMEKIDVNGDERHPIYAELTEVADAEGHSGDIRWNFEKFLIARRRRRHPVQPDGHPEDPALVAAIEAALPGLSNGLTAAPTSDGSREQEEALKIWCKSSDR